MTRSPLLCCTSIIRSSPLVQASSSLSMICARAWPTGATRQRNPFPPFFARVFVHLCWIMSCVASRRRWAFLRRALCRFIMGMNSAGWSSGSSERPSNNFSVSESWELSVPWGSRPSQLMVISIVSGVPDRSLRRLVSSSIRPQLR